MSAILATIEIKIIKTNVDKNKELPQKHSYAKPLLLKHAISRAIYKSNAIKNETIH